MVRISDARMRYVNRWHIDDLYLPTYIFSGTAFGTVILHTSPESAAGGVLAVVQTGGIISNF